MNEELQNSYRWCEELTHRRAKNFYYGIKLLPHERRLAMCAVYAFFRDCDDISDDEAHTQRRERLEEWRRVVFGAEPSRPMQGLLAFRDAVNRYAIPARFFSELIDGMLMDLDTCQYRTYRDTYRYCYHAASTVGLVCVHIFGFDERLQAEIYRMAEMKGEAFQMTNILRDLSEDCELGRCYLPSACLERFGVSSADIAAKSDTPAMRAMIRHLAELTEGYYAHSEALERYINPESRACLRAMTYIYHGILGKIRRLGPRVLRCRARLNKAEKVLAVARALDWRFALRQLSQHASR